MNVYSHIMPRLGREAALRFDEILREVEPESEFV